MTRDNASDKASHSPPHQAAKAQDRLKLSAIFTHIPASFAIAGAASNAGKTWLAEELIAALKTEDHKVCALKVTRTHGAQCPRFKDDCGTCDSLVGAFEIISNETRLNEAGKDTARYRVAGADQVLWLLVHPDHLQVGIKAVLAQVQANHVLVAEGNSFCDYTEVNETFMALGPRNELKHSAEVVWPRIDHCYRRSDRSGAGTEAQFGAIKRSVMDEQGIRAHFLACAQNF